MSELLDPLDAVAKEKLESEEGQVNPHWRLTGSLVGVLIQNVNLRAYLVAMVSLACRVRQGLEAR